MSDTKEIIESNTGQIKTGACVATKEGYEIEETTKNARKCKKGRSDSSTCDELEVEGNKKICKYKGCDVIHSHPRI